MVKIGPKKLIFWLILRGFFSYALLHPLSYAPRFSQMKYLIKRDIRVKFHQYRVCGCEVFRSKFFGLFLPQILFDLTEIFTRASL